MKNIEEKKPIVNDKFLPLYLFPVTLVECAFWSLLLTWSALQYNSMNIVGRPMYIPFIISIVITNILFVIFKKHYTSAWAIAMSMATTFVLMIIFGQPIFIQ